MKKVKVLILIVLILISTTICTDTNNVCAKNNYFPDNYTGYRYPLVPGTDEWDMLPDHQTMCDACQIPENVLKSLTTEQLVETILYYPLLCDMYAYDTFTDGVNEMTSHFNGILELLDRTDYANEASNILYGEKTAKKDLSTQRNNGADIASILQDNLQKEDRLSYIQKRFLQVLLFQKKALMNNSDEIIDNVSVFRSGQRIDENCFLKKSDAVKSRMEVAGELSYIYSEMAPGTVKKLKIKDVQIEAYYDSTINEIWISPEGNLYIFNIPDVSEEEKGEVRKKYSKVYGVEPIREGTAKYNCHSYAWYSNSKKNKYWIDSPEKIIEESSKVQEVSKLETQKNDIYVYYKSSGEMYNGINHSAVITSFKNLPKSKRTFTLTSKWGRAGLYEHSEDKCPYYYWRNEDTNEDYRVPRDVKYFHLQ